MINLQRQNSVISPIKSVSFANPINSNLQQYTPQPKKPILFSNIILNNTNQALQPKLSFTRYPTPIAIKPNTYVNGINTGTVRKFSTLTAYNPNQIKTNNLINPNTLVNGSMNNMAVVNPNLIRMNSFKQPSLVNNMAINQKLINTIKSTNQNLIFNNNPAINSMNLVTIPRLINTNTIKNTNIIVPNTNTIKSINKVPTNIAVATPNVIIPNTNTIKSINKVPTNIAVATPNVIIPNTNTIKSINIAPTNIAVATPNVIIPNTNTIKSINLVPTNINLAVNNNVSPLVRPGIGNNLNAPLISLNPMLSQQNLINNNIVPLNANLLDPHDTINLAEFRVLNEIGEGTFGKIYKVIWLRNNRFYALKKEVLSDIEGVKVRQHRNEAIRNFIKSTNCKGIVNLYGNLTVQNGNEFQYFELMELCDKDFEQEIKQRAAYNQFYTEIELYNIMLQLISTLSFLQKMHITHRDIKPQNILILNGLYKLCDFGDIRVMQREGIVVQRVRGSELYMSPILFAGLRAKVLQVRHNTYRSDVFSLGMCFLLAACLSFNGCVEIREVLDMNQKLLILNKYLGGRYSVKIIKILHIMLETEENIRPDFILLEALLRQLGI